MRWVLASVVVLTVVVGATDAAPKPPAAPIYASATPAGPVEAEVMRSLASAYWAAFNDYDPEKTLAFLEEGYRKERGDIIRREIGLIRTFRIKLEVSEDSPPHMIGPRDGEMYLTMVEPIGTRRIRMAFRLIDGEWQITSAQEVR